MFRTTFTTARHYGQVNQIRFFPSQLVFSISDALGTRDVTAEHAVTKITWLWGKL